MQKIKITGSKAMLTSDYGALEPGQEYNVSDALANFLFKRGAAEPAQASAKKAPAKKAAAKKAPPKKASKKK